MSIKIMAAIFESDLTPTKRLIMLSLADHANDEGVCYPSVSRLCKRTGLGERAIQKNVKELVSEGYLKRDMNAGQKGSNLYILTPAPDAPPHEVHPAPDAPTPRTRCTPTPAPDAPEPSLNHQEPSGETNVSLAREDEFSQFWACVPKKVAKGKAEKAFAKARKIASLSELIDGMERYARQRDGQDAQYTCHPATWLNEKRWLDEHQHTQADFHREIDRMLGDSDGLQRTDKVDHHEPQRLSAPVSAPAPSGHGREPDRGEGDSRGNQQPHLSLVKPRRFGGTG